MVVVVDEAGEVVVVVDGERGTEAWSPCHASPALVTLKA